MLNNRNIKADIPTPKLDTKEFEALTDLLYEALKGNQSQCARMLGINIRTWKRWEKEPPTWPWWNLVLRNVIREILAHLRQRSGGITRKHLNRIRDSLSMIPEGETLAEQAEMLAYDYTGAQAHLRRLLSRKGMYWDEIRLAANTGGYTQKTLRVAAKQLKIIKTQEGFGENKRSYWRLPDQDDD